MYLTSINHKNLQKSFLSDSLARATGLENLINPLLIIFQNKRHLFQKVLYDVIPVFY